MTDEIPVTGCIFCRNHSDTIWKKGQLKLFLKVHQSFFLQALDGLLPLQLLHPYGKLRIYIVYDERHAVELAVIHLHLHEDHHPLPKRRTGHRLEIRGDETIL